MKSQDWSEYDVFERIEVMGQIIHEVAGFIGKIGRIIRAGQYSDHPLESSQPSERESHDTDDRGYNFEDGFSPNGEQDGNDKIPVDGDPDESGSNNWV